MTSFFDMIANGVITLVAAFAGAWAAFKLEDSGRNRQKEDDDVAAGNRALFTLMVIWNTLNQYQTEVIEERRGFSDAWFNLAGSSPLGHDDLAFEVKELSFLLQTKGSVFQRVLMEADRFHYAMNQIDQRSEIILQKVFPALSEAGIKVGESRPLEEIESILGVSVVHQLKIMTDAIITNVDQDVMSSRVTFDALRSALNILYPKRKFISGEFNPPKPNVHKDESHKGSS